MAGQGSSGQRYTSKTNVNLVAPACMQSRAGTVRKKGQAGAVFHSVCPEQEYMNLEEHKAYCLRKA